LKISRTYFLVSMLLLTTFSFWRGYKLGKQFERIDNNIAKREERAKKKEVKSDWIKTNPALIEWTEGTVFEKEK